MQISNSKKDKYLQCPKKYDLHYNEKLRSIFLPSSLLFGRAIDEALNTVLLNHKNGTLDCPYVIFKEYLSTIDYNKVNLNVKDSELIQYFKSDYDFSLLSEENKIELLEKAKMLDESITDYAILEPYIQEIIDYSMDRKRKRKLTLEATKFRNLAIWYSLLKKGELIIDYYIKDFMPLIEKVVDVQVKVTIENDTADEIIGYIDFLASFKDEPNKVYICDNKTSSSAYKKDSVINSEQLATYCEFMKNYNACYVVVQKRLRKREPQVKIEVIKDVIPENNLDAVFDSYVNILDNIKSKSFPQNFESKCSFFGRPCEYYNLCHKGSLKNLVNLKEN